MRPRTNVLLRLVASIALAAAGCSRDAPAEAAGTAGPARAGAPLDANGVVLDGKFDDWNGGAIGAVADGEFVWVHATLPEAINLQGAAFTTTLAFDLDGDASTGRADDGLGTDLEVTFSPKAKEKAGLVNGIALHALGDGGRVREVKAAACGFEFAPTFAAKEYEFRLARRTTLGGDEDARFSRSTKVRGRLAVADAAGASKYRSESFDVALPALAEPALEGEIPARAAGAVRIASWNVEKDSPEKNPAPFARVFRALDPDVVLVQEWQATPAELTAWFTTNVPSTSPWNVVSIEALGVAVVTRLPASAITTERLPQKEVVAGHSTPMRYVAALVDSPLGPLVVASVHLKCCGALGTWEDECRKIEARAINDDLRRALVAHDGAHVVLAGDFNLVGTRDPLDLVREGLDADGSDLEPIETRVLGDRAISTWADAKSEFAPGRLDWSVASDSALEAKSAFVLDTALLPDRALAAAKLERGDSGATDHRTMVLDLALAAPAALSTSAAPELRSIRGEDLLARVTSARHPVLVNLWATWCAPCVAELPDLLRVRREFADRGVEVVLVSCDGPKQRDAAIRLLAKLGVDFESCIKEGSDQAFISAIAAEWNGTLPLTLGFDAAGKKCIVHEGAASYEEFRGFAERLLAPATGPSGN